MEMRQDLDTLSDQTEDSRPGTHLRNTDEWKKGGRLLSGLVGSNVFLFGAALATCVFTEDVDIYEFDFLIYLSVIMVICILWMFFQMYFTWRNKHAILYKDCQAGPIWMRAGIIIFGVGTLVMASVKIIHAAEHIGCGTPMKIIQPAIQAIFVIVQTCFLWKSCKHCVQIYINATRCFLMVLLTVNLIIWIYQVAEESIHHTIELHKQLNISEDSNSSLNKEDESENEERCGCRLQCKNDTKIYIYLYPFNIEYNLFAAAMIYIMWKNVGRQIDDNASHHHGIGPGFRQHIPLLGLMCGLTIFLIGLVMFIMYEIGRDNKDRQWLSLTTFCIYHVVSLALMCLANLVGMIIFRLDKRNMDKQKNPSRALDTALLLGATLGQYAISYYSSIAMVSTQPFSSLNGLMLSYSILMILQHSIQNAFIIEGLHRLPPNLPLSPISSNLSSPTVQHETIVHITAPETDRRQSLTLPKNSSRKLSRRGTLSAQIKSHLKKRKTMKDVYLFLFLCNIIFWIMPAFGARIRFDNGIEVKFYGFGLWAIITNISLPFGIFYRMHTAATLLELYSMS
ncbi:proton channel OTOP2-like [Anomaloglossus baeobatrachus]|uniref:proton channel OTOP2-like n=1 Tax=Anomaloglossus baeobatrachus TaxID=238106 RepID=UPI003F50C4F8